MSVSRPSTRTSTRTWIRTGALLAAVLAAPALPAGSPASAARSCPGVLTPGFLAVAAPYATVHGQPRAGTVTLFSSDKTLGGLKKTRTLIQGTGGIGDTPERNDAFGSALAKGDFDGDGCADLAIGASEEFFGAPVPGADGHGVVHLLFGSPDGLTRAETIDVAHLGRRHGTDRFGAALAAGDLDGDGDDELVVGAPGMDGGGGIGVFGMKDRSPYGMGTLITQTTGWVGQEPGATDQFGAALATGDFDGNGKDEIAVGAPGDGGLRYGSGVVTIIDPRARRAGVYTQESPDVKGYGEKWDAFGAALASGDFNADGRDDLAIGVPGEDLSMLQRGMDYGDGAVNVLYGSARGLTALGSEVWSQTVLKGTPRYFDRFGTSLAAGDLNGDGDDELVVGVPGEGAVQVIAGTRSGGLTRNHNLLLTGPANGDFGASIMVEGGKLLVAAPGTGRLTLIGTKAKKGSYPGVLPRTARVIDTGGEDDLFGYALS
ncbi:FG-GAP repeat protein [Planotetraspora sp. A-T 1434]|uniref:FG-GAP repeat protein n=1 Tax=Planotetraspora sp. A-T 1434 TaxID=2979219 RepID=UPI0021C1CF8B|nr:FG-GAP repeat protein [Planotetraspora sp. A-T 1434]MCT9933399.1 FG-GAP repeat protein [Planotetraspora sp. A-T 1434]